MKYLNIAILLVLLILIFSAIKQFIFQDAYPNNIKDVYDGKVYEELSQQEIKFVDSLSKRGFLHISILKPVIGLNCYKTNVYSLILSSKVDTLQGSKFDSFSKKLAMNCYGKLMTDSMINDCSYLLIGFNAKLSKLKTIEYERRYSMDSLANWCGFKVIQLEEDKFKRESYKFDSSATSKQN